MSHFVLDLFFASFFVLLLVFLARIKDKAFVGNRESYRYTLSGIFVLFMVSLLRLLDHQDLFRSVPFFSEPVYQNLAEAIGIVTGIALMIAGVSVWLPIKKNKERDVDEKFRLYFAIQKIEDRIQETRDVNRLFESIPEMICGAFGFASSAVFRMYHKLNGWTCTNCYNPDSKLTKDFEKLRSEIETGTKVFNDIENKLKADFHLPLNIKNTPGAIIFFWKSSRKNLDNDEKISMDRIGRTFSRHLTNQLIEQKLKFLDDSRQYLLHMRGMVAERNDIRSEFHNLHRLFGHAVGSEYLSLAILDKHRKNLKRFTMGIDRRVFLENGSHLPIEGTQIDTVMSTRKSLLIENAASSMENNIDSLFLSCGQGSLMAIPIINFGRVIAVLTLGRSGPGHFSRRDLMRAEMMAIAMAPAIEAEISRQLLFERDRYLGAISAFDSIVEKNTDIDSLLISAAEHLMENIRTTMVRITILNNERTELATKSLRTIRPFNHINTGRASISKEMTPWHQMVIQENRLLLINQLDPESSMGKNEACALVFDKIQSALVVPISVGGRVFGLITLGEMRSWDRFSYDSTAIVFCREIAAKIANGIRLNQLSKKILKVDAGTDNRLYERTSRHNILTELKSPITSIRGSLDLLRLKEIGKGKVSNRIIAALEKSTNRLISIINEGPEEIVEKK